MAKRCPECGENNIKWNMEKGEIVCKDCGLVLDDKLVDFGQEWREFDGDGANQRRTGAPLTYAGEMNMRTEVGSKQDIYSLKGSERRKMDRLRRWQNRVANSVERNLRQAMSELKRVVSTLKLSSGIEEEAARIYTIAVQQNLVRGRPMEAVVAGSIYAACRKFNFPRALEEVADAVSLQRKEVGRTYRYIIRELNMKIMPSSPHDYLPKLASTLELDAATQTLAAELIQRMIDEEIGAGKTPNGMAAAAIYVAATMRGVKRTQRQVADAANVTEVTIRNRYKEIEEKFNLKKDMVFKTNKREKNERKGISYARHKRIKKTAVKKNRRQKKNGR